MAGPLTDNLRAFLDDVEVGTLGVVRTDGRPHLSVVYHVRDGDKLYISTEPTRLKGRAIAREGWATYAVRGRERPYPGFTCEGPARLLGPGEGLAEYTTRLFTLIFGQAPDEPLTDEAVVAMNRTVIELDPIAVYGVSYLEA